MAKCFSFTSSRDRCYRHSFENAGLKSITKNLGEGTTMHCWAPKTNKPTKPNLILIPGFGANAMWQWDYFISPLSPKFNLYVPNLVFFGKSYTTRPDRSESFQAQCVMKMMKELGVEKFSVTGISYGGFVAYSMAAQFREAVEKVVIVGTAVCIEEKEMEEGLFSFSNVDEAADMLLPQSPRKLKKLMQLSFYKPPKYIPSCFHADFIQVMLIEYREERKQLIEALHKGRKPANLPKINQPTLIIWGEQDRIFPIEQAHKLKRHIGDNAQLAIIEKAGHALSKEKPKKLCENLIAFLTNSLSKSENNSSNGYNVK